MTVILSPSDVRATAAAIPDARVQALAASHERLRAMFEEAAVRAEKPTEERG